MRVLFDKNVPIGLRQFLFRYEVRTIAEMGWPLQLENGELLRRAEASSFDVLVTADQNIRYQQNLSGRRLALVVLGSNIWPLLQDRSEAIAAAVNAARPGTCEFVEIPVPAKPGDAAETVELTPFASHTAGLWDARPLRLRYNSARR